jgi:hypothetical protein
VTPPAATRRPLWTRCEGCVRRCYLPFQGHLPDEDCCTPGLNRAVRLVAWGVLPLVARPLRITALHCVPIPMTSCDAAPMALAGDWSHAVVVHATCCVAAIAFTVNWLVDGTSGKLLRVVGNP